MSLVARRWILLITVDVLFCRIKSFDEWFVKVYIYIEKLFLANIQESLGLSIYGIEYRVCFLEDRNMAN
jgi:hypothetical protein